VRRRARGRLVYSLGVPAGHGHYFGANVVDAWVALTEPDGWTDDDTRRLRQVATQPSE
jgi:uncharacterized membrane protein